MNQSILKSSRLSSFVGGFSPQTTTLRLWRKPMLDVLAAFQTRNMRRRRTAMMVVRWRSKGFYAAAIWSGSVGVVRLSRSLQRQDNDIACMLVFGERSDSVRVGGRLLRMMLLRRTLVFGALTCCPNSRPAGALGLSLLRRRTLSQPQLSHVRLFQTFTHFHKQQVKHLAPCDLPYLRSVESSIVPSPLCRGTKPLHKGS